VLVVEPVFAEVTLNHKACHGFNAVTLFTVAIYVEKRHIVCVFLILKSFDARIDLRPRILVDARRVIGVDLAKVGHSRVATVTAKVNLVVKLIDLVAIVTMD
jgi:hypothetical protein